MHTMQQQAPCDLADILYSCIQLNTVNAWGLSRNTCSCNIWSSGHNFQNTVVDPSKMSGHFLNYIGSAGGVSGCETNAAEMYSEGTLSPLVIH